MPPSVSSGQRSWRTSAGLAGNALARVFFLNHVESPQRLQEIATEVRTAAQIQRTYPNNQARALVLRGTGDQIAQKRFRITSAHQRFAYEKTAETERLKMTQRFRVL